MCNEKTKKIAFFTGSMTRGGAEKVISLLASDYSLKGYSVEIVCVLSKENEYPLDAKVCVKDLSSSSKLLAIKRIKQYLAENSPDIVLVFMWQICLLFGLASSRNRRYRLIMSERNDPRRPFKRRIFSWLINSQYKKADTLVIQTESVRKCLPGSLKKKCIVIPNPIKISTESSIESEKTIVTAGRLEHQKNQLMLIDAFFEFSKTHQDYSLEIFGEGRMRKKLEKRIKDLNLSGKVFLRGNVPNLHERIKKAEMFVLSSDYEGLPNALLEAMAMGMPVISTAFPGSEDYIKNKKNGITIKKGDKNALVLAMNYLSENKSERVRMGAAGKDTVSELTTKSVLSKWSRIID